MKKFKGALFVKRKPDIYRCKEVKKYAKGYNYCRSQPKRRYGLCTVSNYGKFTAAYPVNQSFSD